MVGDPQQSIPQLHDFHEGESTTNVLHVVSDLAELEDKINESADYIGVDDRSSIDRIGAATKQQLIRPQTIQESRNLAPNGQV